MLETFNWVLGKAKEAKLSTKIDTAEDEAVTELAAQIEHAGLDEAETLAAKVINEQIEQLKVAAQKQMVCSLHSSVSALKTLFRAFWSRTSTSHHCQISEH